MSEKNNKFIEGQGNNYQYLKNNVVMMVKQGNFY